NHWGGGLTTLAVHGIVVVLTAWLTAVVWLSPPMTLCRLRKLELALFAMLGIFFGFLQAQIFAKTALFDAARRVLDGQYAIHVIQLFIDSTAARWVFLIIIYGVFIPNTWRRCALLTGVMALAPLVITPLSANLHGRLCFQTWLALLDLAICMGTAMAVAVFGSYRLQTLQQAAFQAKQLGQYRLGKRLGAGG